MKLFVALSCLQGRPMRAAFEELRALADGVQLTPGNAPTVGFSEWVRSQPASVRTHQGFTPMALRAAVCDDDGNLLGAWDSVHPPSNYGDEWLARPTIKPCIEIMYPGKPLGSGPEIERAMDAALDLAVDVSHIHIQLCSGSLSPRVWRRLQDYERVREVHVSANDGRRDRHQCAALQSAVLFVAQYWNDEASDAVHVRLAYSLHRNPDVPAYLAADRDYEGRAFVEGFETARALGYAFFSHGPSSPAWAESERLNKLLFQWIHRGDDGRAWHDNGDAIPLFAAYCREGAVQDDDFDKKYSPFAVFRRPADGDAPVDIEIIGKKVRPWLEGVSPISEAVDERESQADERAASIVARLQHRLTAYTDFGACSPKATLFPGNWGTVSLKELVLIMVYCREGSPDLVTNALATRTGPGRFSEKTIEAPQAANTAVIAVEQLEAALETLRAYPDEFAAMGWP